jgi:TolB protein
MFHPGGNQVLSLKNLSHGIVRLLILALSMASALPGTGWCQGVIDIFGPSIPRFPICVFPLHLQERTTEHTELANEALRIVEQDLRISGFFEILDPSKALADPFRAGLSAHQVDWDVLRLLGADIAIQGELQTEDQGIRWETRVFDQPQRRLAFGKAYRGRPQDLRIMAHRLVDEVIAFYTGAPGIFQTKIAFLSKHSGAKEIYLMDADGENLRALTKDRSITLSPRWSPDGGEMVFISYSGPNAYLYLLDLHTMKRRVLSGRENLNGPAAWAPDGQRLALTLTIDGNPEIYLIDRQGTIIERLTEHHGIDVSPSWSPDGRQLAFVSNRSGSPQIYILQLPSGQTRRLTYEGNYNTDPVWSPRGDRIAFSSLLGGNYEICSIRSDGTDLVQLTDSPANDESPSWSPDGRYLAFSSTRSGPSQIFAMLFNGENPVQITKMPGEQSSPVWSPWLKGP